MLSLGCCVGSLSKKGNIEPWLPYCRNKKINNAKLKKRAVLIWQKCQPSVWRVSRLWTGVEGINDRSIFHWNTCNIRTVFPLPTCRPCSKDFDPQKMFWKIVTITPALPYVFFRMHCIISNKRHNPTCRIVCAFVALSNFYSVCPGVT